MCCGNSILQKGLPFFYLHKIFYTLAYQAEGAYQEDGKQPSIIDKYQHTEGVANFEVASDFYHHYKEDIQLFKELGLKAFRFSIA
ncbi:TPA: family 1 glycosylhydrolase, partial [Pseudomonas aeruginosa]|nr:family 1 glycosylhydrolase [Pseudomonas aeruginosa]